MSAPTVVMLEGTQAFVLPPSGSVRTVPIDSNLSQWSDAIRDAAGVTGAATPSVVLIIGGAWFEVARPALPPMAARDRRRALHHQADRFFAIGEPIASTIYDEVVVACSANWLAAVRRALAVWARVDAVLALPEAAALLPTNGAVVADATSIGPDGSRHGASVVLTIRGGAVRDARAKRGAPTAEQASVPLDIAAMLARVQSHGATWSAAQQLLDATDESAMARALTWRWWRASAFLAASLLFTTWALGTWRERTLIAAQRAMQAATSDGSAALAARDRLARAEREAALIANATGATSRRESPSAVLVRLGALIPSSAFVQRLEWDGQQWRIDGSATDAAALVPRLDGDGHFDGVRSLAPSTRFLDGGAQRSSFSIGFTVRRDSTASPAVSAVGGVDGRR